MAQCPRCGAGLAPDAIKCTYCGEATPLGFERARLREQQTEQAQRSAMAAWYQARAEHARTAVGAAKSSVTIGILSIFFFCFPLGIVPIALSFRARKLAREAGMDAPASATVGLVLGIATTIGTLVLWTYAMMAAHQDSVANDKRIAELEPIVAASATNHSLTHDVACQSAELKLRKDGYGATQGTPQRIVCEGKLTTKNDMAMLEDFRFHLGQADVIASVCLKYGVRWYVDTISPNAPCFGEPTETASASASGSAFPAPPVASSSATRGSVKRK